MGIYDNNREFSRETLHIVMHIGTVLTLGNHLPRTSHMGQNMYDNKHGRGIHESRGT
jgi:hypothetical protein